MEEMGLREIIGQAIGEASMLWSRTPKGVFQSDEASKLIDRVIKEIEQLGAGKSTSEKENKAYKEMWEELKEWYGDRKAIPQAQMYLSAEEKYISEIMEELEKIYLKGGD